MNQDLANQLNSSKLSNEDIQNLMKTLGQTSLGKKGMKLTPQERNNLLNKMTSTPNPAEYMVEKEDPTKNMTEDEKKQYLGSYESGINILSNLGKMHLKKKT